jgi:hypothetical protein
LLSVCKHLKGELNTLKKEYVAVLQSFFSVEMDNHKYRINSAESVTSNPGSFLSAGGVSSSFSVVPDMSANGASGKPSTLYGGDKYKNRLRGILEECRRIDPMLPTWDSLLVGNGLFIDKYGFKYDKSNEAIVFQYLCEQLAGFFDNQPNLREDKFWRSLIKEWRVKFVKTVKYFF